MKKRILKRTASFVLAGVLCFTAAFPASADVYYSGNAGREVGPGVSTGSGEDSGISLDAADYAETGGVARGGMELSDYVPEGYTPIALLTVSEPVVADTDPYTYDYMFHDMDELSKRYSGLITYRSFGQSRDGRNLYEIIVGNQNASTHLLFTAAIHGREHITANLMMKQIEYLLYCSENKGAFDGRAVSDWLRETCIHFVPMINPDGVTISQLGIDGLRKESSKQALRDAYQYDTENARTSYPFEEYCRRYKANAAGVDLNQNFPGRWAEASGTAAQGSYSGYKGARSGSEPESQALMQLYNTRHYKAVVNYHSMGNVIYWDIPNNKLREHSRDLANNLSVLTGYQMLFSGGGGGFKDYVQLCSNPTTSVTLEVGTAAAPVPISEMPAIWEQNKYVPFFTMAWAKAKGK